MALIGVALEAAEHYMKTTSPSPSRQPQTDGPPPMPRPDTPRPQASGSRNAVPPPPPKAAPGPLAEPVPSDQGQANKPAILLIRAMIAAAHADGHMDAVERQRILKRWQAIDLSAEEQAFLSEELLSPASLEDIVRCVGNSKQALQVYALSRLVMTVDSEAERQYLRRLAQALHLDAKTVHHIESKLRSAAPDGGSS